MKKLFPVLASAILLTATVSASNESNGTNLPASAAKIEKSKEYKLSAKEVQRLYHRLNEIKGMDINSMSVVQKNELRQEVTAIKEQLKHDGVSIYLSGAAIIIIILLIILL